MEVKAVAIVGTPGKMHVTVVVQARNRSPAVGEGRIASYLA